jgi:AcrR family transcriptional regulator
MSSSADKSAKERLLISGAELFAERGFRGVSVRYVCGYASMQVCKYAGPSRSVVHHYFGSKAGLLDAIVEPFRS